MVILAFAILILAILAIWGSSIMLKKEGFPKGRLIYADTTRWQSTIKPFFDQELGLTGKPDYILKNGNQIIPVEIKSSSRNSTPPDSHIYQLAAYCYLIQKEYHQKPTYGIIHYTSTSNEQQKPDQHTYAINYTKELETRLYTSIKQIRTFENSLQPNRSHQSPRRCKRCGYRTHCEQKL